MLTTAFPEGRARVRALGVWSAVNAAGGALGVLAGGLLSEYAGWRWVMLVNLPIVATALALSKAVRSDRPRTRERLDVLGAVLATSGVALLVYSVTRGEWPTLAAAAALLAAFVFVEARSSSPLLRPGLLRSRWVAGANAFVFLAAAGQFAAFYFVSLYMQEVLHMGAAATGAAFLPFTAGVVIGTVLATRLTNSRTPRAALIPGGLLAAAGFAWFARISPDGNVLADVLAPSLLASIGLGLCLGPVAVAATQQRPPIGRLRRAGRPGVPRRRPHRYPYDSRGPQQRLRPKPCGLLGTSPARRVGRGHRPAVPLQAADPRSSH
jgi:predicted MFS family arabinose efflux permease